MPDSICTTLPTHWHRAWRSSAGAGSFIYLLATVLLACGHASSSLSAAHPGGERLRRELAARLLAIDLRHEQLRQWVTTSSIAGKQDRLAASDEVRHHIVLVTELLKRAASRTFGMMTSCGRHRLARTSPVSRTTSCEPTSRPRYEALLNEVGLPGRVVVRP